jgi:hypothetical protein
MPQTKDQRKSHVSNDSRHFAAGHVLHTFLKKGSERIWQHVDPG